MLLNTLQHTGQPPNRATRPHGSAQRQVLQAGVGTKLPAFPEEGKGLWCPQQGGQEPWREAPRVWVPFWRITLFVYMSLSFPNPRQSRSNRPPPSPPPGPRGCCPVLSPALPVAGPLFIGSLVLPTTLLLDGCFIHPWVPSTRLGLPALLVDRMDTCAVLANVISAVDTFLSGQVSSLGKPSPTFLSL